MFIQKVTVLLGHIKTMPGVNNKTFSVVRQTYINIVSYNTINYFS